MYLETIDQWNKTKLGDIVFAVNENETNPLQNGISKYVAGGHMESESIYVTKFGDIKTSNEILGSAFHRKFSKGDILFGTRRAYLKKAGIVTFDGICANTTLVLRPKHHDFANGLLPFIVQWEKFTEFAVAKSVGSTNPYVRWRDLASFEFYLPPFDEQLKMQTLFWTIQKSIDALKALINKLKIYKTAKMDELFTRGIGHKKFKRVKWLFGKEIEIPESWKIKHLFELSNNKDDIVAGPFGSNLKVSDYQDEGVPIIRLQNIERNNFINKNIKFINKSKSKELAYHSYLPGDLVLAKLGDPIGKTCNVPPDLPSGIVVADVVRIRVTSKKADRNFVTYVLNSSICAKQYNKEKIGTTRPRVNLNHIRRLQFPTPPFKEQQKIASILSGIDEQISATGNHLVRLQAMRKEIINERLTPSPKREDDIVH